MDQELRWWVLMAVEVHSNFSVCGAMFNSTRSALQHSPSRVHSNFSVRKAKKLQPGSIISQSDSQNLGEVGQSLTTIIQYSHKYCGDLILRRMGVGNPATASRWSFLLGSDLFIKRQREIVVHFF